MKEQLLKNYFSTPFKIQPVKKQKNIINVGFQDGPFIEILGPNEEEYEVIFEDTSNGSLVHSAKIRNNMWTSCNIKYYVPWKIKIKTKSSYEEINLNLKNQKVCIINESGSIGDTIAWMDAIDKFQKKHDCTVDYYSTLPNIFDKNYYSNINFFSFSEANTNKYAYVYKIGCFRPFGPNANCSKDWRELSLGDVANEILGLPYGYKAPELIKQKNKNNKKRVCIATQSTAQAKYWNNSSGWQQTVDYLKNLGYEVVCLDKDKIFGSGKNFNTIPNNCTDKTGNLPFEDRIEDLYNCDFFIGLGSGLSWLAWACKKPVILISGFSSPRSEFYTKYRVHNNTVCNSCWNNIKYEFNPGDWLWCPEHKNDNRIFECSRQITFEMVKEKIDNCIKDLANENSN